MSMDRPDRSTPVTSAPSAAHRRLSCRRGSGGGGGACRQPADLVLVRPGDGRRPAGDDAGEVVVPGSGVHAGRSSQCFRLTAMGSVRARMAQALAGSTPCSRVECRTVDREVTALGWAGPHGRDRPARRGRGGGRGFNGGQLLHLAVAGCISNDLFREAAGRGLTLRRVVVTVDGDFAGDPAVSTGITCDGEGSTATARRPTSTP